MKLLKSDHFIERKFPLCLVSDCRLCFLLSIMEVTFDGGLTS